MNNHYRPYRKLAIAFLSICLILGGSANLLALCFSGAHDDGFAVHFIMHDDSGDHSHASLPNSDTDALENETHCIDIPLRTPTKNIRSSDSSQQAFLLTAITHIDPVVPAKSFFRHRMFGAAPPIPSPPIFILNQSLLN